MLSAAELADLIAFTLRTHDGFAKKPDQRIRFHDRRTPYGIHPSWCAMTLLTETTLAERIRVAGAHALLLHDVLEDTTAPLPDGTPEEVRALVEGMTFGSSAEEMREVWNRSAEVQLLKVYDKVSTLLDASWKDPRKRRHYEAYTLRLAKRAEQRYGQLNIVTIAKVVCSRHKEESQVEIVQVGDPVLRAPAAEVEEAQIRTPRIQTLIARMRDAMHEAPGVGLAAPQIGESLQIAVVEDTEEYQKKLSKEQRIERARDRPVPFQVLINPTITWRSEDTATFFEGCLSVKGYQAEVERPTKIKATYWDRHGQRHEDVEFTGWHARIVQHEADHLRGVLYVDRMNSRTLTSEENHKTHLSWRGRGEAEHLYGPDPGE